MSTFDIMRKASFSSIELPSAQSLVQIKLYHTGNGSWELERYHPKTNYSPSMFTTIPIEERRVQTILRSYDQRNQD
jgi:hypothetical protein